MLITSRYLCALGALALLPTIGLAGNKPQSIEELTDASDKVVFGTVGIKNSHWGNEGRIYTDVVFTPDVALKGANEGPVIIEVLGGTVGDTEMWVSDGAEFQTGERALVFLKKNANGNYEVTGRADGKLRAGTPSSNAASEAVLRHLEKQTGQKLDNKRSESASYMVANQDALTSSTTTTTAADGCWSQNGAKWAVTSATYRFGTTIPSTWYTSLNSATSTWNSAGVAFQLHNDQSSTNTLEKVDLVAKYGSSYSNTYALTTTWTNTTTNAITKAQIEIGTKWTWSTSGQANMADVQDIMTHEFGHWMRLLDIYSPSTCSAVTMWGSAPLGEISKRTLEADDIAGLKSLYGASPSIGAPTLLSPSNGAGAISTTPKLTWSAGLNATSYDVYFGTSSAPAFKATVTGTSYAPGTLTAGTKYYWRVVAKNTSGSATSTTWSFTTTGGTLQAPVLVSPTNGATGQSLTPTLKWNAVTGATSYDLYFGTTSSPSLLGNTTYTAVTISGLQSATTYYWKVVAKSSTGSAVSTTWHFATN